MTVSASKRQRGFRVWAISLVAVGFGLLTIKEGGTILFGDAAARSAAGNYVPFVLWFNFVAGFVEPRNRGNRGSDQPNPLNQN